MKTNPGGVFLLFLATVLSGCGYALVGRGSNIPADIKNVYIKPLENRTTRQQVDQILTRALADEMVTRKRFAVVNEPAGADAEISGAVLAFAVTPVSFDSSGRATQYEIAITVQGKFRRIAGDTVLWSNEHYLFRENYDVETTSQLYFNRETEAIEKVAPKFAQTLVSDLLEGF